MRLTAEQIAKTAHEVNRAYCHALGDYSHLPWRLVPENIKQSAINGVEFHLTNPDATPEQLHANWMKFKTEDGWTYGEIKDSEKKEHPCMLPYGRLPLEQRAKDFMFAAVVDTLKTF
jgi:hypothetical protein